MQNIICMINMCVLQTPRFFFTIVSVLLMLIFKNQHCVCIHMYMYVNV